METILIGNGIDLQYGGAAYYNDRIIQRAIRNVTTGNFRTVDYPSSIIDHLNILYKLAVQILHNPSFITPKAWSDEDKKALGNFISRYSSKAISEPSHIGFEDYFLIQRLYFNLHYDPHVGNDKERTIYYDNLRRFFLDAIYNHGEINNIEYPSKFGDFLSKFDSIYTLNYDRNIEKVTSKTVNYLHGAFHVLSEKDNNNSPMNQVMHIHTDVNGHEHLYSTALTTYCGKEKEDLLVQADRINSFLALAPKLKAESERTGTPLHPQIKTIIDAYELCPQYEYPQNYCYDQFEKISGNITILGVSPTNDDHLVDIINSRIDNITFYYYPTKDTDVELKAVEQSFPGKPINFLDVSKLWLSLI